MMKGAAMKSSNNRIDLPICCLLSVVTLLSCNDSTGKEVLLGEGVHSQPLTYQYDSEMSSGATRSGSVGVQTLWTCVSEYCNAMHKGDGLRYSGIATSTCMGDLFMELVDGAQPVTLSEEPSSVPIAHMSDFQGFSVAIDCGVDTSNNYDPISITFTPFDTVAHRNEVRELALRSYYAALNDVKSIIDSTMAERKSLAAADGDDWFLDEDPIHASGRALLEQAYASIPTLVDEMAEIEKAGVEETLNLGVADGEEWAAADKGRLGALKRLNGSAGVCTYSWEKAQAGTEYCWREPGARHKRSARTTGCGSRPRTKWPRSSTRPTWRATGTLGTIASAAR
jgi:hypothetical protein